MNLLADACHTDAAVDGRWMQRQGQKMLDENGDRFIVALFLLHRHYSAD